MFFLVAVRIVRETLLHSQDNDVDHHVTPNRGHADDLSFGVAGILARSSQLATLRDSKEGAFAARDFMTGHNRPALSWQPILSGSESERARNILDEVAVALAKPLLASMNGASVGRGTAGVALFFCYLSCLNAVERWRIAASDLLDQAVSAIDEVRGSLALLGGMVGVAWAVEHLGDRQIALSTKDPRPAIDHALCAHVRRQPWLDHYDLVAGLVGHGVYALARLHHPSGREILQLVIQRLTELAVATGNGMMWPTSPELLPEEQRRRQPHGYVNLGVAHGVPGIIALLARAIQAGVAGHETRVLLDAAVAWLLTQRKKSDALSFPSVISLGDGAEARRFSRLAWCYGDLGLSMALFGSAVAVGEAAWRDDALAIARRAALRPIPRFGVRDAGLCHGAAGVAHIFNRFYQATGEEVFGDAARHWFAHVFHHHRLHSGVGGFRVWWGGAEPGKSPWRFMPGLVEGTAGIGLALLAAVMPTEPAWDQLLFMDVPAVAVRSDGRTSGSVLEC
jgi:lantibiotic biosynthesis protein